MMTESTIVRKFSKERHSETKTQYTAHGENSVLVASIDDEKTIESFAAYSAKNGELIASAASLLGMTLSVKAEAAEVTEGILSGEFQSLIIYTDDPKAAIVLACILMQKHLDYLISPESSEAMPDLSPAFEETVTDREKGRILVGYLAAFEKDASLVVTADKLDKAISSLFLSGKSRCILILPLLSDEYIPDFPKLVIRKGKSIISKGNNDTFKRLFLYTLDSFRIQPEKFIYAYLLNAIDSSDTLGTVRRITEHFRYTRDVDEEYGTSILHNALCSGDGCFTGCIASGGAAYKDSENDSADIIRYLVSLGFHYGKGGSHDLAGMGRELADSYKLGNMFRVMMEAGYDTTPEDL